MWVSRGMKCSFFGKFGVLCFFETPVLRFTLLQDIATYIHPAEATIDFSGQLSTGIGPCIVKNIYT